MAQARLSGKSASCCQYRATVMAPSVKPLFLKNTISAFIAPVLKIASDVSKCNKMRKKLDQTEIDEVSIDIFVVPYSFTCYIT